MNFSDRLLNAALYSRSAAKGMADEPVAVCASIPLLLMRQTAKHMR